MQNMERMLNIVCDELDKIAEKGLNTGNLETAYKLIDMYKDLKDADYRTVKKEFYEQEMGIDGYSERYRKRDNKGRYSREGRISSDYERDSSYSRHGERYVRDNYSQNMGSESYGRYLDSKQSYRANKTVDCKQRLMNTLEDYMDDFSRQMQEMLRDSDCAEERETIKRYMDKIKNAM